MAPIDYKSFGVDGSKPEGFERRWWKAKTDDDLCKAVAGTLQILVTNQRGRHAQYAQAVMLYGNSELIGGVTAGGMKLGQARPQALIDRLTFNIAQSVTDTLVSKIARNKPLPDFVTSRANYKIRHRAKRLNQFTEGLFGQAKAHRIGLRAFRDAAVLGDGFVHVYPRDGRVVIERVPAGEIFVDILESYLSPPTQLFRAKRIDRDVLAAAWPSKRGAIETAITLGEDHSKTISDLIDVIEAWHLPSREGAKDGRHVIVAGDAVLLSEPWDRPRFPFAQLPFCERMYGFYSQGLVEQLTPIQIDVNKTCWTISRSYQLSGSFKIFVEESAKVTGSSFDNQIGTIIKYRGPNMPQYVTPPILPGEVYSHLESSIQRGYAFAGVSALSASGQKPAGISSGRGLLALGDIEADRWVKIGQGYENFYLDVTELAIDAIKEIVEEKGNFKVRIPGKEFLDEIEWKDVDLERDQYELRCAPVSSLPRDPAGRFEIVTQWVQAGWITDAQAKRLMDVPDLDSQTELDTAAEDYLHRLFERFALEDGFYEPPDAFTDLQSAATLALKYLYKYANEGAPEKIVQKFRDYELAVQELLKPPAPPPDAAGAVAALAGAAGAAAPGPGGAPMAKPIGQPTSDILPIGPAPGPG